MAELVLASGNPGKLRELGQMFEPLGFDIRPQSDWDTPEAVEDGLSFLENALIKARNATLHTGRPALADDSGLVVPALGGAPGIHSARYADGAGDLANNEKLLREMSNLEGDERRAHFHCTMVLIRTVDDPVPLVASADWWGRIGLAPSGDGGFGYDPLFEVPERGCTSAQLSPGDKNAISHRGQALQALVAVLKHRGAV